MRLDDAGALLAKQRYHGALYLAGYSVECALKWAITRKRGTTYLPGEFEIHDLDKLMGESGLARQLQNDHSMPRLFSALADEWGPHGRYDASKLDDKAATRLYNQIRQVYSWILERAS